MDNNITDNQNNTTRTLEERFPLACRIYDGMSASLMNLMNKMTPQENEYLHQTRLRLLKLNTIGAKKEYHMVLKEDKETDMEGRYQKQIDEAKENIEKYREPVISAMNLIVTRYEPLQPFLEKGVIEELNKRFLTEIATQLRNDDTIEKRLQQLEKSLGEIADIDNIEEVSNKQIQQEIQNEQNERATELKRETMESKGVTESDKIEAALYLSQKFGYVSDEIQRNNELRRTVKMNRINERESETEHNITEGNGNTMEMNEKTIDNFIVNMGNESEADVTVFKIPNNMDDIVETLSSLLDTQGENKLQFDDIFNHFRDVLMKWEHRSHLAHLFSAIFLKKNLVYPSECTILKDDGNIVAMGWEDNAVYAYVKPNGELIVIVEDLEDDDDDEDEFQIDYSEIAEEIKPYMEAMENSVIYDQFEDCMNLLLEQFAEVPMESCYESERMF